MWSNTKAGILLVILLVSARTIVALAQPAAAPPAPPATAEFGTAETWTYLFLLLGPWDVWVPFLRMTRGADERFSRQLALRTFVLAGIGLGLAALLGGEYLAYYHIPVRVLAVAGGLILFWTALQTVLKQYQDSAPALADESGSPPPSWTGARLLAFPAIVSPPGVGAVIIFMTIAPDSSARLGVGIMIFGILVLDLLAMMFARQVIKRLSVPLALLKTVLGLIQVALGLQIMLSQLSALGVFPFHP